MLTAVHKGYTLMKPSSSGLLVTHYMIVPHACSLAAIFHVVSFSSWEQRFVFAVRRAKGAVHVWILLWVTKWLWQSSSARNVMVCWAGPSEELVGTAASELVKDLSVCNSI